jgi:hypothetical protein
MMSNRIAHSLWIGLTACAALTTGGPATARQSAAIAPAPATPAPDAPLAATISARDALSAAPQVRITNKRLSATVLLPDPDKGFYRGVRFDWAGMIASLTYEGQDYYGLWFDRIAPDVRDFAFRDGLIVAAPNTAAVGPVDAYDPGQPLGWSDAPAGGTFVKIGVGVLRKPADGANYSSFRNYDLVDHGVWKVEARGDRVIFTQTVSDPLSGYGYVYRKELRLTSGRPGMEIRHSLKNTGARSISTTTFNHNFLTFGGAPAQAGLTVGARFPLRPGRPLRDVAQIDGQTLTYRRALAAEEIFSTPFATDGLDAPAYDLSVSNAKGAGFSVKADRPLSSLQLWSIRSTVAFEPFVTLKAEPGQTVSWTYSYTYAAPTRP